MSFFVRINSEEGDKRMTQIERYKCYLDMMNQWLILLQEKKSICSYIEKEGWRFVAVYGMSIYGRHVIRELKNTDCIVAYGIDRKAIGEYEGIKILKPVKGLPKVDVVINAVIHEHDDIRKNLQDIVSCPIISLEDIVFESY